MRIKTPPGLATPPGPAGVAASRSSPRPIGGFAGHRAALALGLILAGCGGARDDLPREGVSGKVTFEGEPLARGAILFKPSSSGAQATDAGGMIRDGEYRLDRPEGPVPGSYKVLITEEVERPKDNGDQISLRPQQKTSRISAKYNANTTLTAEVKPGLANVFNFDLKKSNDRESPPPRAQGRQH